jgi:Helix-turn-helix domain
VNTDWCIAPQYAGPCALVPCDARHENTDQLGGAQAIYTLEFKLDVLKDVDNGEMSMRQYARKHGISPSCIRDWKIARPKYSTKRRKRTILFLLKKFAGFPTADLSPMNSWKQSYSTFGLLHGVVRRVVTVLSEETVFSEEVVQVPPRLNVISYVAWY